MQKMIKLSMTVAILIMAHTVFSQDWQPLEEGQEIEINNIKLSFITSYIKEVNGQDVYEITATLNNMGADYIELFPRAVYSYMETQDNAWTHFKFTNATGKGMSAREGFIYPEPIHMSFPYKCNPEDKKMTYENRVIGVGLNEGQYKTKEWRVRVEKGDKLKVMVFNKF